MNYPKKRDKVLEDIFLFRKVSLFPSAEVILEKILPTLQTERASLSTNNSNYLAGLK